MDSNLVESGFNGIAKALHQQLKKSGISTEHEEEYRKIISYVLKDFHRELDISSVNDLLFDLLTQYREPARTKAIWTFSLLDDFTKQRTSDLIVLPLQCNCGNYYIYNNETYCYACDNCKLWIQARPADNWVDRR